MGYYEYLEPYAARREIVLRGTVNSEKQEAVCARLEELDMASDKPIVLLIDTDGGSSFPGHIIADTIRHCKAEVHAHVIKALSAGFVVLQACDVRIGRSGSAYLFHYSEIRGSTADPGHMDGQTRRAHSRFERFLRSVARRSGQKFSLLKRMALLDTSIGSREALKLGLIDKISRPRKKKPR